MKEVVIGEGHFEDIDAEENKRDEWLGRMVCHLFKLFPSSMPQKIVSFIDLKFINFWSSLVLPPVDIQLVECEQ